jgi:general secretion pathway protein N
MSRRRLLVLLGVAVFLLAGIATLPAGLVAERIAGPLKLEDVYGSVWSGGAERVSLDGAPLGTLDWQCHPLALLRGRLAYTLELTHPHGHVRGEVALAPGGSLSVDAATLELPITALDPHPLPGSWLGRVAGEVRHAKLIDGWPVELAAKFTLADVHPPNTDLELGRFALDFDPEAARPDSLVGRIRDLEGPVSVRAQLSIRRDRSYLVEGEVAPKPGAPPEVASTLAFLGPPDRAGRRGFSIQGLFQTPDDHSRQPPSRGK